MREELPAVREQAQNAWDPLARLLQPLEAVALQETGDDRERTVVTQEPWHQPTWLANDDWHVYATPRPHRSTDGEELARFATRNGEILTAHFDPQTASVSIPFSFSEAYRNYVTEAWTAASNVRRLSPRQLDAFYRTKRFLPRPLQLRARRALIRWQGFPRFPRWPYDTSIARLLRFYAFCLLLVQGREEASFRWFWPERYSAALILTHDVETASGLRLSLDLADLEEEAGFRSSFNLGNWYAIDPGIVRELTDRGFEIGVHGIRHDRSLFESRLSFEAQQPALARLASAVNASGFRSPSTHRVFEWLAELPLSYDCSIPHSDPFEPQPGGCCSVWPFFVGHLVELPYTLPQDHTLFTLLGHRTAGVWLSQAELIESEHGLIQCVTHPDRGYLADPDKRSLYKEFLIAMAARENVWKALPRELAEWWRRRDQRSSLDPQVATGVVRRGDTVDEVSFEPPT